MSLATKRKQINLPYGINVNMKEENKMSIDNA